MNSINAMLQFFLDQTLSREDCIIGLGGGVVGDASGFAASIYLRGIPFIQFPTSLLAQVDASIGGKTGINHKDGKNLIGSFYQPKAIFIDFECLKTLNKRELRCGLAEVIKYGFIKDQSLLEYIEKNHSNIIQPTYQDHKDIWKTLVQKSAAHKVDVVSQDEKESSLREILNFGHTIGHAIESASDYGHISHGEAIAIGMKGL